MKIGMRSPSLKRSVKARTTGRMKRAAKKAINPIYGEKGAGYLKDPERAVKNKIYHKVTVDPLDPVKKTPKVRSYGFLKIAPIFLIIGGIFEVPFVCTLLEGRFNIIYMFGMLAGYTLFGIMSEIKERHEI